MVRWGGVGIRFSWLGVFVVAVLGCVNVECCVEEERLALLEIKAYMQSYSDDPTDNNPNVRSWFDSRQTNDCCEWDGVSCSVSTGRVTELDLGNLVMRDDENATKKPWMFNVTKFHPFRQLISLDLSNNRINGLLEENGFCKLWNIEQLKLNANLISGRLPSCLLDLSALQTLDVAGNRLTGKLPSTLSNLTSLQYLDLSYNSFDGRWSLSVLANISKLQILRLSGNRLQVQTEDSAWQPKFQLQALRLADCSLNQPHHTIPKFLFSQYNLTNIDLSHNNLVGSFPTWLLTNNSQLYELLLVNNSIAGNLQLPSHANFSLKVLGISSNKIQGQLPENMNSIFSELFYLNMSRNHFQGHIPTSIGDMSELSNLDLSHNNFSGHIPRRIFSHLSSLQLLGLSDNNLQGEVIPDDMNLPDLSWLKLSNNRLGGTIKDALQKSWWSLFYLDISNNSITGELPRWLRDFSRLNTLSMSKNDLQGRIPSEICRLNLQILDLSENNFSGAIPSCTNFSSLVNLHLQKNRLTGTIPRVLSSCSFLKTLDLRDNQLSGGVPDWINKLQSVVTLLLAGNILHGHIPYSLCQLKNLNILDLSRNKLSGEIPTCLGNMSFGLNFDRQSYERWEQVVATDEYVLDVSYMQYSKPEEVEFLQKNQYLVYSAGVLVLMSGLDLSCNKLTGIIPSELGKLGKIRSLNISHNHLIGSIPSSFSLMNEIESLDLSSNSLSGTIPSQLVELSSLSAFNVSYNNLSGRVPVGGQFGTFDERNYFGNPGLYGFSDSQMHHPTTASMADSPTRREEYDDHAESYIADFFWTFGISCAIMFLTTVAILYINPQCRRALFGFVERHLLWWLPTPWLS